MIIKVDLDLSNSSIESLGDLKEVGGGLFIDGTKISFLPKDLKFKWVYFKNSNIEKNLGIEGISTYSKEFLLNKYPQIFK